MIGPMHHFLLQLGGGVETECVEDFNDPIADMEEEKSDISLLMRFEQLEVLDVIVVKKKNRTARERVD